MQSWYRFVFFKKYWVSILRIWLFLFWIRVINCLFDNSSKKFKNLYFNWLDKALFVFGKIKNINFALRKSVINFLTKSIRWFFSCFWKTTIQVSHFYLSRLNLKFLIPWKTKCRYLFSLRFLNFYITLNFT